MTIGYMPFEITIRDGSTIRTTVIDCIDIDSAAIAAVSLARGGEAVVQVRDVTYDEAEAVMDSARFSTEAPYRIEVDGDVAYADEFDAALLAAHTLVEDGVGEEDDRRESATIFLHGIRNGYASALARRGCRSEVEFHRQELEALRSRSR